MPYTWQTHGLRRFELRSDPFRSDGHAGIQRLYRRKCSASCMMRRCLTPALQLLGVRCEVDATWRIEIDFDNIEFMPTASNDTR